MDPITVTYRGATIALTRRPERRCVVAGRLCVDKGTWTATCPDGTAYTSGAKAYVVGLAKEHLRGER